jgi:hypothetical protein
MNKPRRPGMPGRPFLLALLLLSPAAALASDPPGPPAPPGESRPRLLQGRLGNGLRYVILPRRTGGAGVGLLMQIEGGFLAERRPGERGLAHLIEHLVFHSPTRSAPDDPHRFRTVGMPLTLPEPAGGTTSWRESDYFVVSRTTKPADLDVLLALYREVASELDFHAVAVDEQRAEVMREMADKRLGNEISARYIAAVAPGSPNDMIDAQNSDDVPTANIETIRAFYHRVYRPENTTIAIVGDVDARQVEALVRKRFGDWRGIGPTPNRAAIASLRAGRIAPVSYSALPEGRRSAMITVATPLPPPASRRSGQADAQLRDMVVLRAVNHRLGFTQAAGPPGKFGAFIENGEQGRHRLIMLWDNFEPGRWRPAITGLKRTACELSTTGLPEQDWSEAKRYVLQDLERRSADMPNIELAGQFADSLAVGRHPIPPDEMLRYARARLPALGARAMNDWWSRQWRAGVEHVRVEAPELGQVEDPRSAIVGAVADAGCAARLSAG